MAAAVLPHDSLKSRVLGRLIGTLMKLWSITLRFEIQVADACQDQLRRGPVIFYAWHNRIFVLPTFYQRAIAPYPVRVLTSASKDGAILEKAVACFGLGAVRGSSSRRGAAALVEMRRILAAGDSITITPDGPRGPCYALAPGLIKLAQVTGAPLVALNVRYAKAWRLKSWDRFFLPKPFSKVVIEAAAPVGTERVLDEAAFQRALEAATAGLWKE